MRLTLLDHKDVDAASMAALKSNDPSKRKCAHNAMTKAMAKQGAKSIAPNLYRPNDQPAAKDVAMGNIPLVDFGATIHAVQHGGLDPSHPVIVATPPTVQSDEVEVPLDAQLDDRHYLAVRRPSHTLPADSLRALKFRGWPLVRPVWLHYESDAATLDLHAQFLLGDALLVAPVLAPRARSVRAYLPAGRWLHAFPPLNGTTMVSAGEWVELDAPLGSPAALVAVDAGGTPPDELLRFLEVAAAGAAWQ